MKKEMFILVVLLMMGYNYANACPRDTCERGYEQVCEMVKECKVYKNCEVKVVCADKNYETCDKCKAKVCHIPPGNPSNAHNICVGQSAVKAHLDHGDYLGDCKRECEKREVCNYNTHCKNVEKCECKKKKCDNCNECKDCDNCNECKDCDRCDKCNECKDCDKCDNCSECEDCDKCKKKDAGCSTCKDAGAVEEDGSVSNFDAGAVEEDGSVSNLDAGVTEEDSSLPRIKAVLVYANEPEKDVGVSIEEEELELLGGGCSYGGNLSNALIIPLIFGLFLLFRRRVIIPGIILLMSFNAYAYDNDYYRTEGGKVLNAPEVGLMFNYERRPSQIVYKSNEERITDAVAHRTIMSLQASMGFWNRLEVGLTIPFELSQRTEGLNYLGQDRAASLESGLGNLVFMPKLRLFTYDTLHLGLIAPVVFPTMTYDNLVGSSNMTFSPQLVFEFDSKFVDVALNFGYSMRDANSLKFRSQNVKIDDAMVGSLGAKVLLWENRLELVGDSYFSMDVNEQNEEEVPVEVVGGLRFYFPAGFQADVGAGAGLTKGINAPAYRLLAGLKWRPVKAEKVYVEKVKYIKTKCPVVNCPLKTCPKVERNKITIPSVYFDTDKDFVIPQSIPVLLDVVQILKDNPWVKEVRVEGNADWRASNTYNYKLALRRAQYVYNFLVRNGVDKDRIFTVSFGEGSPAYSNATKEGMSRNRRVEFHITEPK